MSGYGSTYGAVYPAPAPNATPATVRRIVRVIIGGALRTISVVNKRPGPLNTGAKGALTPSGSVTANIAGQVISNLDISGGITVAANGVVIRNCRIRAVQDSATSYTITRTGAPTGLLIEDCTIDGNGRNGGDVAPYPSGWAQSAALQPGIGYTMRRCNIFGHTDGLKPQDNPAGQPILIENCWIHDLVSYYSAAGVVTHNDILQVAGAGVQGLTVKGCTLDGYRATDSNLNTRYASSSLIQWGSFPSSAGVVTDVLLEGNWIDGGTYASRVDFGTAATVKNVIYRHNRYGLRHRFGILTSFVPGLDGGAAVIDADAHASTGTTDYGAIVTVGQPVV